MGVRGLSGKLRQFEEGVGAFFEPFQGDDLASLVISGGRPLPNPPPPVDHTTLCNIDKEEMQR